MATLPAERERERESRETDSMQTNTGLVCIILKVHTFAEHISDKIGHRFTMFVDELHVLPYINC